MEAYIPPLYCTVLHCTVLYCTVLYCTVGDFSSNAICKVVWKSQVSRTIISILNKFNNIVILLISLIIYWQIGRLADPDVMIHIFQMS